MIKIYRALKFKIQEKVLSTSLPVEVIFMIRRRLNNRLKNLVAGLNENAKNGSIFNFRRNIHRLEKGLSNNDRRSSFALTYISSTVDMFVGFCHDECCHKDNLQTLIWGKQVLDEYFSCVEKTEFINEIFEKFNSVKNSIEKTQLKERFLPYKINERVESNVSYEDFKRLSLQRRSVRHFLNKEVEIEKLNKAVEVASLSPSACNRQPFKFVFIKDKEIIKQVALIPGGINGYEEKIPCLCLVVGDYSAYSDERDFSLPIIDGSLASMSLQYAFETLGLSSFCVNWPLEPQTDRKVKKYVDLKPYEFIIMLIGIGYPDPDGMVLYSKKRDVAELSRVIN